MTRSRRRILQDSDDDEQTENLIDSAKLTFSIKPHAVKSFLSQEFFNLKKKDNAQTDLECSICLEKINCIKCFTLWTCGHYFHASCCAQLKTNRCPICNL